MSFDKAYPNRKDHRKPFYGIKADNVQYRNHGDNPTATGDRTINQKRVKLIAKDELKNVDMGLVAEL